MHVFPAKSSLGGHYINGIYGILTFCRAYVNKCVCVRGSQTWVTNKWILLKSAFRRSRFVIAKSCLGKCTRVYTWQYNKIDNLTEKWKKRRRKTETEIKSKEERETHKCVIHVHLLNPHWTHIYVRVNRMNIHQSIHRTNDFSTWQNKQRWSEVNSLLYSQFTAPYYSSLYRKK